VKEQQQHDS